MSLRGDRLAGGGGRLERVQRSLELPARGLEQGGDLLRQRAHFLQQAQVLGIPRIRRVVDQQHGAQVGELLQGGGEERLAHDVRLLAIRGHDHGQRRIRLVEGRVDHRPGRTPVVAHALQVAEPCQQIGGGRGGQERHDQEIRNGLDQAPRIERAVEVALHLLDEVRTPGGDRQEEREAGGAHRAAAGHGVHDRRRAELALAAPLPARARPSVGARVLPRLLSGTHQDPNPIPAARLPPTSISPVSRFGYVTAPRSAVQLVEGRGLGEGIVKRFRP